MNLSNSTESLVVVDAFIVGADVHSVLNQMNSKQSAF